MIDEIEAFLESYLAKKRGSTKKQTRIALKHWEEYVRQKPCSDVKLKDIDQFILHEKKSLKPHSLHVYLFHIAKYFHSMGRDDLEEYVMEERKKLKLEFEAEEIVEPSPVDHNDILKMLMEVTELEGKLLVRLLVFSDIPIGCLEELEARHIYDERKYEMYCRGKRISGIFYSDTPEVIHSIKKEKELTEDDDKIISITERHIQNLIPQYAKRIGIKKRVTPKDLRRFGKNPNLRRILIELYENAKKR